MGEMLKAHTQLCVAMSLLEQAGSESVCGGTARAGQAGGEDWQAERGYGTGVDDGDGAIGMDGVLTNCDAQVGITDGQTMGYFRT